MRMIAQNSEDLSICIVTYNRCADIERALASVFKYAHPYRIQVWVVDNHSTDGTLAFISRIYPQVNLIRNTENVGYAPAMNQAFASVVGQFILTLSHDAELKPGTLQALMEFMQAHPKAGLLGPRTLDDDGNIVTTTHHPNLLLNIWTELIPLKQWLRRSPSIRAILGWLLPNSSGLTSDYSVTRQAAVLDGGCLLIRRTVIEQIGVLDPAIPQGPDDYDFCYRASKAGFENWFVSTSEIVHRTQPRERSTELSLVYLQTRLPQFCYLYGKYHRGLSLVFFKWSAYLLAKKWEFELRRMYGKDSMQVTAVREAARVCLHPENYRM